MLLVLLLLLLVMQLLLLRQNDRIGSFLCHFGAFQILLGGRRQEQEPNLKGIVLFHLFLQPGMTGIVGTIESDATSGKEMRSKQARQLVS